MNFDVPGYTSLASVFQRAYDQAAKHKGAERHANDKPFHEQPMQTVANHHGIGFILGQASKKSIEAQGMLERGDPDKAIHELLGAINYLAGAIINTEMKQLQAAPEEEQSPSQASVRTVTADIDVEAMGDGLDNILKRFFARN